MHERQDVRPPGDRVESLCRRKVAFLMPAGQVVGRDTVVSYHHSDQKRLIDADINIGDTFVFEATLRLVDFDEALFIGNANRGIDQTVEELNSCDLAILRGSNYIHAQMNWGSLGTAIERSQIPVVAFGIGAQAPRYEAVQVSTQTERILKIIAERSHSVGCRGAFTVETLAKLGIQNAVPIGCPSLFRKNDRNLRIQMPPIEAVKRIAFTIARGISGMYCDAPHVARQKQLKAIQEISRRYEIFLITQSEKAEKLFYFRTYDRINEAKALMRNSGWDLDQMPWLEQLYWSRIFFGSSPAEYEAMMAFCDLAVGYRLHGNIMALSIGKPAIYHVYDSRTRELVQHFAIPSYDIIDEKSFLLEEMLSPHMFDGFNKRFPHAYDEMRDFLVANQIPHRMVQPTAMNTENPN